MMMSLAQLFFQHCLHKSFLSIFSNVLFFLSTTPFYRGVLGRKKLWEISFKYLWGYGSVIYSKKKNTLKVSVFMILWIYLCCGDFTHFSGFGDFIWWCILILWHVYFGDLWFISVATVDESYICMLFGFLVEDVASISWVNALFACIITLIEIERYTQYIK